MYGWAPSLLVHPEHVLTQTAEPLAHKDKGTGMCSLVALAKLRQHTE